ncbi:GDP-perosamine synthase [bioreactor metagenome]|uniref:GDP-perosamine synthase n=1 Tax=bioreactor metagenome TaxID=1076179 RepID=A0A644TRL0_9ZZZZ
MSIQNDLFIENLVQKIKSVLPIKDKFIPLHEPSFTGNENKYVKECIDTGWVSSVGKYVDLFEKNLANYTGVKRAVAVVNGTAALHISMVLAGVKAKDEVIVPALTFIATANAVSYCNAVPHFADSAMSTLGMDPVKLDRYLNEIVEIREGISYNKQTNRRISAVVPMHTFGHPVDLDKMVEVCEKYHLVLIEDAAESIGSFYKGKHTGNLGKVTALSFNGNKTITTGGGGAILTNDEDLGMLAKYLTTQAKVPHRWKFRHDMIGYNYRMPNINAALGCAQLEQLSEFIEKKRRLAERYEQIFTEIEGISFFKEPAFAKSNYWLNVMLLDEIYADKREDVLTALNDNNIMARPVWDLMYTMPMYEQCPRMECSVAETISRRLINLPSSVVLEK